MDATELKASLLALIATDPDVRAALREAVITTLEPPPSSPAEVEALKKALRPKGAPPVRPVDTISTAPWVDVGASVAAIVASARRCDPDWLRDRPHERGEKP